MRLAQGLGLVGLLLSVGILQVWQRSALWIAALDLGRHVAVVHTLENEVQWLRVKVASQASPATLVQTLHDPQGPPRSKLVAWSEFPAAVPATRLAQRAAAQGGELN